MSTEITKKEETNPTKKYSEKEARDFILYSTKTTTDPQENLSKFANEYLADIYKGTVPKEKQDAMSEKIGELSQSLGVETGYSLIAIVKNENRGLAVEIKRNLQKEFDCQSYSEKMLVDLAVSSYLSKLHYTNLLRLNQTNSSSDHNGFRACASKEIDRAHRQFISAIETLKFMKQPALKVNVKTTNAFIGEKQQFNNNQVQKDENNETK